LIKKTKLSERGVEVYIMEKKGKVTWEKKDL